MCEPLIDVLILSPNPLLGHRVFTECDLRVDCEQLSTQPSKCEHDQPKQV